MAYEEVYKTAKQMFFVPLRWQWAAERAGAVRAWQCVAVGRAKGKAEGGSGRYTAFSTRRLLPKLGPTKASKIPTGGKTPPPFKQSLSSEDTCTS